MKSVLISIQPKWCELIGSGKKTVEVRKTKPKLETPFKVYIYCTKPKHYYKVSSCLATSDESLWLLNGNVKMCDGFEFWAENAEYECLNRKVIGEFVCDRFIESFLNNNDGWFVELGCLTTEEINKYQGDNAVLYGWHISNLVIYDKPKELGEFYRECEKPECEDCPHLYVENTPDYYEVWCGYDEKIPITRPPQSWCYVESEVQGE